MIGLESADGAARRDRMFERQVRLAEVGPEGQAKILSARVLVVGAGALGHPVHTYLAAAGVGKLGICDFDTVDVSNLHRQPLFGPADEGQPKTAVLARELRRLHPSSEFVEYSAGLTAENSAGILADWDIVVDCTDRFSSRFLVHDACAAAGRDLVSVAVGTFSGQIRLLRFSDPDRDGGCLRCLFPETPADGCTGSCAEDGILGAAAGVLGSLAALVALQHVLGIAGIGEGCDYQIDLKSLEISGFQIPRDKSCSICNGAAAPQPLPKPVAVPLAATSWPAAAQDAKASPAATLIIDVREPFEVTGLDRTLLPAAENVPMAQVPAFLAELDPQTELIFICEHGMRSERVRNYAEQSGFAKVRHVQGGFAHLRELVE